MYNKMVSSDATSQESNPFQCIIDAPVDKILDAITDYFKDDMIEKYAIIRFGSKKEIVERKK